MSMYVAPFTGDFVPRSSNLGLGLVLGAVVTERKYLKIDASLETSRHAVYI